MKIRVNYFYQDMAGLRIEPGEYDIDDKRLSGQGQYLIDNGHATVTSKAPTVGGVKAKIAAPPADPFEDATRDELMALAEAEGLEIEGTGSRGYITREDVLAALQAHQSED